MNTPLLSDVKQELGQMLKLLCVQAHGSAIMEYEGLIDGSDGAGYIAGPQGAHAEPSAWPSYTSCISVHSHAYQSLIRIPRLSASIQHGQHRQAHSCLQCIF